MPGRAAPDDGAPLTAGFAVSALSTNSTRAAAATSTADAAGTVAADGRPRPWHRQIRLDAVWTAILLVPLFLSLIHISEPTRQAATSYAVFCLKKKT